MAFYLDGQRGVLSRAVGSVSLQSFFWDETEITDKLFHLLETSWTQIVSRSRKEKIFMRMAALSTGISRVFEAKKQRGLFP